jgi:hypothetical protein
VDLYDDLSDRAGIDRHLAVNFFGTHGVTEAFLPLLARSQGAIVNVLWLGALAHVPFVRHTRYGSNCQRITLQTLRCEPDQVQAKRQHQTNSHGCRPPQAALSMSCGSFLGNSRHKRRYSLAPFCGKGGRAKASSARVRASPVGAPCNFQGTRISDLAHYDGDPGEKLRMLLFFRDIASQEKGSFEVSQWRKRFLIGSFENLYQVCFPLGMNGAVASARKQRSSL